MAPRPWRPAKELDGALARGDLRYATVLAEELRCERGAPIPLEVAARFLPLIAQHSPGEYDAWAIRWLLRWIGEAPVPTVARAVEIVGALGALPQQPDALQAILGPA